MHKIHTKTKSLPNYFPTMTKDTVNQLNNLNNDFYETIGKYFNHTRNYVWEGWINLIDPVKNITDRPNVLELGCGNGRFLEFLLNSDITPNYFLGLDASKFLLERATERQNILDFKQAEFLQSDLILENWSQLAKSKLIGDSKKYDLICFFGLMHHIPGDENRLSIIKKSAELLSPNGLLIFTTWQYLDVPRLKRRIISKTSSILNDLMSKYVIDINELAENDNILDWQKGLIAYRFSHYYTKSEIENLCNLSGLDILENFEADGKEGNVNRYFITKLKADGVDKTN